MINNEISQIQDKAMKPNQGTPINLHLNIAKETKQGGSFQQYFSPTQGTPNDEKHFQIKNGLQTQQKNYQSNNAYGPGINTDGFNSQKSIDSVNCPVKNSNNISIGSDSLNKQNSINSCDKAFQDRTTPGKKILSKFNYQGIDSPINPNQTKVVKTQQYNPYLIGSGELNIDAQQRADVLKRQESNQNQKLSAQYEKPLSSSKEQQKQYFFQKCVSELSSPITALPFVKSSTPQLNKLKLISSNQAMSHEQPRKNKQISHFIGSSQEGISFSISQIANNKNEYCNMSNNQTLTSGRQPINYSLPRLDNKKISSSSKSQIPSYMGASTKPANSLASLNNFDESMFEDRSSTFNKLGNIFSKSNVQNNKVTQSLNNLSFGLQDRSSVHHQMHKQLQKMQREKQKEEYLKEEVEKVKNVWQQYENQRLDKQNLNGNNFQTDQSPSPLKYQKAEIQKEIKQKMIENQKQMFFNEMISSVKQTANQSISASIISPRDNEKIFQSTKIMNQQSTLNQIPFDSQKDSQIKQSSIITKSQISSLQTELPSPQKNLTLNQVYSKQQASSIMESYDNLDSFWESTNIWEGIVKDSFEAIKKEKIIYGEEFNFQLLLDFLNNVVGRSYQNNEKYLRESLKLIGLTPEVSEIVCDRISRIMSEKYNIKNKQISKFVSLYKAYEKVHLSWNLIDRMGGKNRIEEVIISYIAMVSTHSNISSAQRLLNISNDQIHMAFYSLLSQEDKRHKLYFKTVQSYFKEPLYRISHTKFFFATKLFLERSLQKNKILPQLKNLIYLLIEQMRFFVTMPIPQDVHFLLPSQSNEKSTQKDSQKKQKEEQHSPTKPEQKNGDGLHDANNQNNSSQQNQDQDQSNISSNVYSSNNSDEYGKTPAFCLQIGAILRTELMGIVKIKHALIKYTSIQLNNKNVFEQYLSQLIQIFTLNNNDSIAYYELLNSEKYRTILLLTDDFFQLFSKFLMENLIKNLKASAYFCKDTHKRLQHVKILINRVFRKLNNNPNINKKIEEPNSISLALNADVIYINGGCFFNELLDHPCMIEYILDQLDDIYHNKSELNKLCPYSQVQRSRELCRYILCYLYPFVDQNDYAEFGSAFDFQCYVSLKKLQSEFFIELRRVLKDLFLNFLNFPVNLVSRLIQEFQYSLQGIEFYSINNNGSQNIFQIRKLVKNQKSNNNDEFDDEKQEF